MPMILTVTIHNAKNKVLEHTKVTVGAQLTLELDTRNHSTLWLSGGIGWKDIPWSKEAHHITIVPNEE